MNRETILDKAALAEAELGSIPNTTLAAGFAPRDLWREARACWERMLRLSHRAPRRLRLCESLPLGERRFVAVVEFEQTRFLLGGTSTSLVLLAKLQDVAGEIAKTVAETMENAEETR
jgi:hypothetical protein